jgi:branched-chain amino acid transport system substrate-binding protein
MMILKSVIEKTGVMAKADTVQADRHKIRDGLAALKSTNGLIGSIQRTKEGEAVKPYVYVHAQGKEWKILHDPRK